MKQEPLLPLSGLLRASLQMRRPSRVTWEPLPLVEARIDQPFDGDCHDVTWADSHTLLVDGQREPIHTAFGRWVVDATN